MTWAIYEFLDNRGDGAIESWLINARIQTKAKALLDQKVDLLRIAGPDLSTGLLAYVGGHLYKLRVNTPNGPLRPILCKGPFNNNAEFTFLLGAIEKGGKYTPKGAEEKAEENRITLLPNDSRRRPYVL